MRYSSDSNSYNTLPKLEVEPNTSFSAVILATTDKRDLIMFC